MYGSRCGVIERQREKELDKETRKEGRENVQQHIMAEMGFHKRKSYLYSIDIAVNLKRFSRSNR